MKKWFYWLYLSLGFGIGGTLSYLDGKRSIASFIPAIGTALLAIIQFFCDKNGEKGKRVFQYISIATMVLLAIWLIYLVFVQM